LALTVCYQFFTRYFMNDSASWTEEIARYLLICTVFLGIAPAVRDSRNIHVDFLYRLIPRGLGRVLSTMVDVVQLVFLAYAVVLIWQMMQKMGSYRMTIIDLPMNLVYGVCAFGFACAALRSVQVLVAHWRQGYSALERPETLIEESV
jgi:TRAP-type C4-dicarboxylate transport system permease small subunit